MKGFQSWSSVNLAFVPPRTVTTVRLRGTCLSCPDATGAGVFVAAAAEAVVAVGTGAAGAVVFVGAAAAGAWVGGTSVGAAGAPPQAARSPAARTEPPIATKPRRVIR
jgi:hypothetical protein